MSDTPRVRTRSTMDRLFTVLLVVVGAVVIGRMLWMGRHAPTPAIFEAGYTLEQAEAESARSGKPVLVVASADWCGACQSYKRGALSDESVRAAVVRAFVPTYVNVDRQPDAAAELGVSAIPLTAVIDDGRIVSRQVGALGRSRLMDLARQYGAGSISQDN